MFHQTIRAKNWIKPNLRKHTLNVFAKVYSPKFQFHTRPENLRKKNYYVFLDKTWPEEHEKKREIGNLSMRK